MARELVPVHLTDRNLLELENRVRSVEQSTVASEVPACHFLCSA